MEQTKDLVWEQSVQNNDSWQQDLQPPGRLQITQDHQMINITIQNIPIYVMAADEEIAKAIDVCVDDYIINGGNVADRDVVNGRVVAGWGVRAHMKCKEEGVNITDVLSIATTTNSITKGKGTGDGYKTSIHTVNILLCTPSDESSLERDIGGINNLQWQTPNSNGDDDPDDEDNVMPEDRHTEDGDSYRQQNRNVGDGDKSKEISLVNSKNITITTFTSKKTYKAIHI